MNRFKCFFFLGVFTLYGGESLALDGVFDRTAEISHYVEQLNTDLTREQYIDLSKSIYVSGISDDTLARAIGDRLIKDIRDLNDYRTASQYGEWMIKALGSMGTDAAGEYITRICKMTAVMAIVGQCKETLHRLDWQRRKDQIMASRENYNEGDDMRVAQLLNLLKSNDLTFKQDATYRMTWDKILDDRLMQEIAKQLQLFVDRDGISTSKQVYGLMAHYCKLLGYSHDKKYEPLLIAVIKSSAPELLIRSKAKKAIKRIADKEPNDE